MVVGVQPGQAAAQPQQQRVAQIEARRLVALSLQPALRVETKLVARALRIARIQTTPGHRQQLGHPLIAVLVTPAEGMGVGAVGAAQQAQRLAVVVHHLG